MKRIKILLICTVVLLMGGCSSTAPQETSEINSIENSTVLDTTENLQTSEETTTSATENTVAVETTPSFTEKDDLTEE